ncbi:hypothetical protein [Sphingomonas sp.]|uniref:hypothetical protein n=1 Tax=Sphingomonas sp. TaxID=28214 RepID=UPI001809ED3F|nr:hypothetical protein [Sphingomonas sp.]MBA3510456.1 hypothetical protein [Sphingomonas sp.]
MARKKNDVPPKDRVVGEKTVALWDKEWRHVEGGYKVYHADLRHKVGLHRAVLGSVIMYIGKASEFRRGGGGLAKRLSDFRRDSSSGREHHGGGRIFEHIDVLALEVLHTGSGSEGSDIAEKLRDPMIELHGVPAWNAEARQRKRRAS